MRELIILTLKVAGYSDPLDFSDQDININNKEKKPGYLGTPNGDVKKYDPITGKVTVIASAPHGSTR